MRGSNQSYSLTESHDSINDSADFSNDGGGVGNSPKKGSMAAHLSEGRGGSRAFKVNLKL